MPATARRVLVTGGTGRLGGYLIRALRERGLEPVIWSRSPLSPAAGLTPVAVELADLAAVRRAFQQAAPDLVLHAAALSSEEACRSDPPHARRINVDATALLVDLSRAAGARLVLTSTDLVFDGERGGYRPEDPPRPRMLYGQLKADAEQVVLAAADHAVVRLSLLYGPRLGPRESFFDVQLAAIAQGNRRLPLFEDEWRTPIDYATAARGLVDIGCDGAGGIWHLGGPERLSRLEMGERLARFLNCDQPPFDVTRRGDIPGGDQRPRDVSLDSSRWRAAFGDSPWPCYEQVLASSLRCDH